MAGAVAGGAATRATRQRVIAWVPEQPDSCPLLDET
jgi:hypothetical protein